MAHLALLALFDLGRAPVWTLSLLATAFAAYGWAARKREPTLTPALILSVGLLLRLLLLPLPPTLSEDILRYLWDGKVITAGKNPYTLAPDAPELTALRDQRWEQMPHRQVPTVYPPVALLCFTFADQLPSPLLTLKILLVLADLLACWTLIQIARALELPAGRAAWYCWNPLVTLEIAGMGHVDALMVAFQVAAVYFLLRHNPRPRRAAGLAAGAVLAKLIPLISLPLLARHSLPRRAFLAVSAIVLLLLTLPVLWLAGGVPPGLLIYGVQWEWNGPLFEPLWRALDALALSDQVKHGLDLLKGLTGWHDFWNHFYPYAYPQFLSKIVLAGLFLVVFWRTLQDPLLPGLGRLFGGFVLASATVHPWYLLSVLPWAALGRHRAWLAATALIQLSYWPRLVSGQLFPWVYLLIWTPFFILLWSSSWSTDSIWPTAERPMPVGNASSMPQPSNK